MKKMSSSSNKIVCEDCPSDFILDKNLAKKYFLQFGKLKRVVFKSKSRTCTIEYQDEEGFQNALEHAGEYNGITFNLSVAHKFPEGKKKIATKHDDPIWADSDEIQAELEAMSGVSSRNFNFLADSSINLAEIKNVERVPKLKRGRQNEELGKFKKKFKVLDNKGMVISGEQMDLVNVILSQAQNEEDKYRILDARDKLIRARLKNSIHLKSSPTIGTCPDMCPEKERMMREAQHQVAVYEQEYSSRSMNQCKAVKQYSRSSADQETPLPHELRPVPVLRMTMNYLLHNIMDLCDTDEVNLAEWFHFLWDRTRGIRKDITQQELCCQGAVELVEQCARFHIHCSARLIAEDPSVFDQKINTENLTKCLQTLKYMYHDLLLKGENCPNEAEFRAYIILLNISDGNFMWEVQQLREEIQKSVEVKYALEVYSAIDKNNYVKFFKLVYSSTYLNACILMRYFTQVRITAIKTLLKCYLPRSSKTVYPLIELTNLLAFDDIETTIDFIQIYGLSVNEEGTHIILEKNTFATPEFPYVMDRSLNVVESKRESSVGKVICGKELEPKIYENHIPQNSFDQKGFLVCKDILEESDLEQAKLKLLEELSGEIISSDEDSKMATACKKLITSGELSDIISSKKDDIPDNISNIIETIVDPVSTPFQSSQSIFGNLQPGTVLSPYKPDNSIWKQTSLIPVPHSNIDPISPMKSGFVSNVNLPSKETSIGEVSDITPIFYKEKEMFQKNPTQLLKMSEPKMEIPRYNPAHLSTELQEKHKEQRNIEEENRRLEAIRKEKEIERSEAMRRSKELKEIKKKRQEEECRRRMVELQQEEEILKDLEMIETVKDTIDFIVNEVHVKVSNEKLAVIRNNINRRTVQKVFKTWHNVALKNKIIRSVMECSPVWINTKSFDQCASGLQIPSKNLTLGLIKRYKQGKPLEVNIAKDDIPSGINIVELAYSVLLKKLHDITGKLQKNIFWKVSVSLPDELELEQGLERMENILNGVFQWKEHEGRTIALDRFEQNHAESMTYCIERQSGKVVHEYDANGIIFIAKDLSNDFQRRLFENLKGFGVFAKVPIVIILQNHDSSEFEVNSFIKLKIASKCIIVVEHFTPNGLSNAIKEGLVFLAKKVEKAPPLELDTFRSFIFKNLCSEIWRRASSFARWNSGYKMCLRSPNVVIKLYNEALEKLKKIILNESLKEYAVFPKIFRTYLENPEILPCKYQYFPEFFSSQRYKKYLENILQNLTLPYWHDSWPCSDELELEKNVLEYCETFKDPQRVFYNVMAVLLRAVDPAVNFENIAKVLWTDVIDVLGIEKLKEVDTCLRNTEFRNESIYNQLIVVYCTSDLHSYNSNDWFYIHNPVIKSFINQLPNEDKNQQNEKIPLVGLEKVEETFIEAATQLSVDIPNIPDIQKELANLNALLQDLEDSMKIHKQISSVFEENLNRAIKDK